MGGGWVVVGVSLPTSETQRAVEISNIYYPDTLYVTVTACHYNIMMMKQYLYVS